MPSFDSPRAFAQYLKRVKAKIPAAQKRGLEAAAKILLEEIKSEAGTYQGAVNGLPAWVELSDITKADRAKHGYTENDPLKASGELAESYEMHVEAEKAVVGTQNPVGGYVEVGHDDAGHGMLPPRPIVGGSLFRRIDDVVHAMAEPIHKALGGKF